MECSKSRTTVPYSRQHGGWSMLSGLNWFRDLEQSGKALYNPGIRAEITEALQWEGPPVMAWSGSNRALTNPGLRIGHVYLLTCELSNFRELSPGMALHWSKPRAYISRSSESRFIVKHDALFNRFRAVPESEGFRNSWCRSYRASGFGGMQVIVSKPTYKTAGGIINWASPQAWHRVFHSTQQSSKQTLVER